VYYSPFAISSPFRKSKKQTNEQQHVHSSNPSELSPADTLPTVGSNGRDTLSSVGSSANKEPSNGTTLEPSPFLRKLLPSAALYSPSGSIQSGSPSTHTTSTQEEESNRNLLSLFEGSTGHEGNTSYSQSSSSPLVESSTSQGQHPRTPIQAHRTDALGTIHEVNLFTSSYNDSPMDVEPTYHTDGETETQTLVATTQTCNAVLPKTAPTDKPRKATQRKKNFLKNGQVRYCRFLG
jgi:hypothetical protein